MDVAPPSKSRPRPSSRCRKGGARRAPSPDSACEHGAEDELSEEGGGKHRKGAIREPGTLRRKSGEPLKGAAGQDSDVDSGIVACRKPGQRIGSTSSADTDSSQESRRRIEYSPPIQKNELSKSRSCTGSLRVPKRSGCLTQPSGPVKADHSALKECNRRPPTPLTVFPDSHHCVRFDEQLQLSEQNIRRSCRKLFATLYAQRFSYPDGSFPAPSRIAGSTRIRSRTAPELDLRRSYSPASSLKDGQSVRYARTYKDNHVPVEGRRAANLAWNNRSVNNSTSDFSGKALPSTQVPPQMLHIHSKLTPLNASSDSGFCSYRSNNQCTCHSRQSKVCKCSSPSTSYRCAFHYCNCSDQQEQLPRTTERSPGLFKSSSCSTLSSVLSHQSRPQLTQFPPRTHASARRPSSQSEVDCNILPLQKTSSCSSLLDRTSFQLSNVPVYSDNMVQVYAKLVSVVPDDVKASSQGGRRAKTISRIKCSPENLYDSIRPSSSNTMRSSKSEPATKRTESEKTNSLTAELSKDLECLKTFHDSSSCSNSNDFDIKSVHSSEIYSQVGENKDSLSRKSLKESAQNRIYGGQRPKSVGVVTPSCGPNPVYLKSALKKSTQAAMQNMTNLESPESNSALNGRLAEVEYAVVDKSKKNRFASLPNVNGSMTVSSEADDKDHPPVPPKKLLHKSDFSLYRSRSSSPKKSLLERMQTLTKNAKSALQKAFSTERIYRPEKEERLEASGQKQLQRSKSFMRSLAGSLRRKKKKSSKAPLAELVPQASSNPEWDEQPSGPNSPIHVRGQLLQLNLDGSQVVELTKPPSKPYGFFVARGRVRNSKGVFVSRMRDQETQKHLSGLLDIGDEILEIDGYNVKNADIMEVNTLMANKNTLLLTVLPYICRKDT